MSEHLREQVYQEFNRKSTDELVRVWQTNDRVRWQDGTFEAIHQILQERGIEIPPQGQVLDEEKGVSEVTDNKNSSMSIGQILFSFNGRIGLGTYWIGTISLVALLFIATFIDVLVFDDSSSSGVLVLLARLAVIWPGLALSVKRWHDRNKSGWNVFVGLIPIIGPIWVLIENGLLSGTKGPNSYGLKSF